VTATAEPMRDWWLRTLFVLQTPSAVFRALRHEGDEDVSERAEPVLAIVILAGMVFALSTSTATHLLDDTDYSPALVAVWAFLAGAISGAFIYWLLGAVLYGAVRALGSHGSYRRARHLLAFAAVPVACSLLLWPVELALYGERLFHAGGAGSGRGGTVFGALTLLFAAWAAVLLVVGVRAVHGWSWARASLGALPALALAAILVAV
jgi:hypothetical protein